MATRRILSLPSSSAGIACASSATAWVFGSAVSLHASLPTDIYVCGFQFQNTDIPALDVGQDILFEVLVGGVTKLQIPFNMKADSLVGYVMTSGQAYKFYFPEAYVIPAGSSVTVKVTDSIAAALTYSGVKLMYLKPSFEDDIRPAIILGLDSAQSEGGGWDAKVKPNIPVANVVRTSDTVVTVTLQAQADYDITGQETITVTVPAAAVAGNTAITATPTFTIDPSGGGGGTVPPLYMHRTQQGMS